MFAYSSIQRLVAACGAGQPWVSITSDELEAACAEHGVAAVALDTAHPEGHRYPEPDPREQPELEPLPDQDDGSLVYVPSRPVSEGDTQVNLELQPDKAGRAMLLAYSSPELLVAGCGPYQPWVAIHATDIDLVAEEAGACGVLFNPELAEDSRHTGPVQDWSKSVLPITN